jgi:SAM-dependent methyltransferase/uncharacterized protein YbaR (Trm112 family)
MRGWLLEYLVCPTCTAELRCTPQVEPGDDLESGLLTCGDCGREYPIVNGVPRMAPSISEPEKQRTVDAFGWEWQEFDRFHANWESLDSQFLDWVYPLEAPFFEGKVALDAGCGAGRFSAAMARMGAEYVIGVDLSDSVEAAREFTRSFPNVAIVQGDIFQLPFRSPFDFAFSVGVVHHLNDPEAGLRSIAEHVNAGGSLFVWVYGYENNAWIRHLVNPLRTRITAHLGRRTLYFLSLALAAALHPVLRVAYSRSETNRLSRVLPYYPYLHWLSQYTFRHTHMVVFDHLVAPTAFYVRRDEFKSWFERAGFRHVELSWRNQNSWRGHGRRDTSDQGEVLANPGGQQPARVSGTDQ